MAFYQTVALQWSKKRAIGHLLLLSVVISLPSFFLFVEQINQFYVQVVTPVVKQFPAVTIEQGHIQIDKPLPYAVFLPNQARPYVLFLDTNQLSEEETDALPATVVATKNVIYSRYLPQQSTLVYPLPEDIQRHITPSELEAMLQTVKRMLMYVIFPILVGLMGALLGLWVILSAIISRLIAMIVRASLTYGQRVRLALAALTPPIIVGLFLYGIQMPLEYLGSVLFIMILTYAVFAVYSNRAC